MAGEPNADEKAARGEKPNKPTEKPRGGFWRWLILHSERKMHQRSARREKKRCEEKPQDKAARQTATATKWIAVFTVVLAGVGGLTLYELIQGGADTRALVGAAGDQADAAQQFSDTAEDINGNMSDAVDQLNAAASNAKAGIKATQDAMRLDQRAWIGVFGVDPYGDFTNTTGFPVLFTFSNSGKSPARNVTFSQRYIYSPHPLPGPRPDDIAKLVQTPSQDMAPGGKMVRLFSVAAVPAVAFTSEQLAGNQDIVAHFQDINEGREILYYFGRITYDDVFGKHRFTNYCSMILDPKKKIIGTCDQFNNIY